MGVPLVCYHVADQPHTSSPYFCWLSHMDSQIIALCFSSFYLHRRRTMNPPFHPPSVCPSANRSSFHLPHTETRQWGPHPSSVFYRHSDPTWGIHFTLGHPFLYLYIFSQKLFIIYCTNAFILQSFTFVVTVDGLLSFWPHATHVTLGWSITSHFPPLASSISSEHYPGHLPLSSEVVHLVSPLAQLTPDLVVPPTLDLVTQLRPHLLSCALQPRAVWSLPTS
jgi:hypothetical protein